MKLRVIGTAEECRLAQAYYRALEEQNNVKYVSVSDLYQNRGSRTLYRVYIEVCYKSESAELRRVEEGRKQLTQGKGIRK